MPLICYVPKSFRADTQTRINQANEIIAEYQMQGFKEQEKEIDRLNDLLADRDTQMEQMHDE